MKTTPEQIDLWRSSPSEHQRLEFKEAKVQFDNRTLFKYCVAIANEGGGFLVLGVADKPPRPVVGTAAFNDPVAMAGKLFEAVGFRVDIEEVVHAAGRVLVFHIPSRPRGTAYHFDGAYLMRAGQQLVPMTNQTLRERFGLSDEKTALVSQAISAAVAAGKIKPAEETKISARYRSYVPFWA